MAEASAETLGLHLPSKLDAAGNAVTSSNSWRDHNAPLKNEMLFADKLHSAVILEYSSAFPLVEDHNDQDVLSCVARLFTSVDSSSQQSGNNDCVEPFECLANVPRRNSRNSDNDNDEVLADVRHLFEIINDMEVMAETEDSTMSTPVEIATDQMNDGESNDEYFLCVDEESSTVASHKSAACVQPNDEPLNEGAASWPVSARCIQNGMEVIAETCSNQSTEEMVDNEWTDEEWTDEEQNVGEELSLAPDATQSSNPLNQNNLNNAVNTTLAGDSPLIILHSIEEGAAAIVRPIGWSCPACTFFNEDVNRPGCAMCTAERPDDAPQIPMTTIPTAVGTAKKDPLEWVCPACTFINEADRPGCALCSTDRPEDMHTNSPQPLYSKLLKLQNDGSVVRSNVPIECPICFTTVPSGEGIILNDCLHTFCAECLVQTVQHSGHADVKCPYTNNDYSCGSSVLESEIRALLSDAQYEKYLADSLREAEGRSENAFHCKTPDCRGWCLYEDYRVTQFECPLCGVTNCLPCKVCTVGRIYIGTIIIVYLHLLQVIHVGQTCVEYNHTVTDERDKKLLDGMIEAGDIMKCPACKVLAL